ncbi:hypothetical protein HID58_045265, partial [Brassica napus]
PNNIRKPSREPSYEIRVPSSFSIYGDLNQQWRFSMSNQTNCHEEHLCHVAVSSFRLVNSLDAIKHDAISFPALTFITFELLNLDMPRFSDIQSHTTLMPATVNVAGSAHSGTISRLVQCSHSADLMWFCPIRTDSLLTILFSYSANFDAFTKPVSPILVDRFRFHDLDSLLGLANTNTQLPCDGDDNDGDDMPGTISVLIKDGVGVNDHEESSSAGTTASGLATKKLRVLATPKVVTKCVSGITTVNVAGSAHSGTISRLVQCSQSADLMWFCPIRTDSLLTILFSYSAKFDAFTEPVSPILVDRFSYSTKFDAFTEPVSPILVDRF